ncbi:T9SS type A sorting domain-containing protein [Hymenobacter koreensis]|uniref:T9SS type A sorting domain-containing protein n=1 Tax=Hymenobacter koreensis TaxID=1084523 RepID=A0ABP8J5T7_9BACT
MKQLYITLLLTALAPALAAQDLTNDGAQITVGTGATLFVNGNLTNKAGSTLINNGTVELKGNFVNAGTVGAGTGKVLISGTTDQSLTAGGATLYQLEVAKPSGNTSVLLLPADVSVSNALTLTNGMVRTTGGATAIILPSGTISGEASGRYVQGRLQVQRNATAGTLNFGNGATLDVTGLGGVTATRTAGLLQAGVSYGVNPSNAAAKGIDRIWTISSASAPAGAVPITLEWLSDNDNGLTNFTNMQAWMAASPTTWQSVGAAGAASTTATTRSFSFSSTSLGTFTVSNRQNPLPVELVEFTAERRDADAYLRWVTASEKDNDYFDVESSTDGRTFSRIGTVRGNGTTSQRTTYELLDTRLTRYQADVIYYRLRQVDRDGTASLSPVRTVSVPTNSELLVQAFPNPFGKHLTLRVKTTAAGPVTLRLNDAVGKQLFTQKLDLNAGQNDVQLDELNRLPVGVYVLTVRTPNGQRILKLTRE